VAQAAAFPAASLGGRLFAEISAVVEALSGQDVVQSSGLHSARQSFSSKAVTRDALHRELQMINRTARVMALDVPGLEDKFRLPYSSAEQVWLTAARTFRSDAEPLKAQFLEHDMPADFLETLDGLIEDYEQQQVASHQSTAAHIAAAANIDAEIERGM